MTDLETIKENSLVLSDLLYQIVVPKRFYTEENKFLNELNQDFLNLIGKVKQQIENTQIENLKLKKNIQHKDKAIKRGLDIAINENSEADDKKRNEHAYKVSKTVEYFESMLNKINIEPKPFKNLILEQLQIKQTICQMNKIETAIKYEKKYLIDSIEKNHVYLFGNFSNCELVNCSCRLDSHILDHEKQGLHIENNQKLTFKEMKRQAFDQSIENIAKEENLHLSAFDFSVDGSSINEDIESDEIRRVDNFQDLHQTTKLFELSLPKLEQIAQNLNQKKKKSILIKRKMLHFLKKERRPEDTADLNFFELSQKVALVKKHQHKIKIYRSKLNRKIVNLCKILDIAHQIDNSGSVIISEQSIEPFFKQNVVNFSSVNNCNTFSQFLLDILSIEQLKLLKDHLKTTFQSKFDVIFNNIDKELREITEIFGLDLPKLKKNMDSMILMKKIIRDLRERKDSHKEIISLIEQRIAIKQEIETFENEAKNPQRLKGSSLRLLEEEKFRKRKNYTLLVTEKELIDKLQKYAEQWDEPFLYNGKAFEDLLNEEIEGRILSRSIYVPKKI
ncbi:Microtubule-associated protein essential for anaphase spindle elongation [Pseudoloma neurophilia]|uniref:Microtubule-associated protein essential for anaphase spindle elongation n=1 Tax=Pseudoloma neurophilia TaxID=146866 RepID=A0A0R0M1Z3_9MICR|nr:Microtubule-associated protein essential for anaphase spindle elongation [Pseudoloma neurophilia]